MKLSLPQFFKRKTSPPISGNAEYSAVPSLAEEPTQALDIPAEPYIPEVEYTEQQLILASTEAASCMTIGTREYQQDAVRLGESNGTMVGILCDGMGGLQGGEQASNLAADYMLDGLKKEHSGFYSAALKKLAFCASEQVRDLHDLQNRRIEAGSTLTVAVLEGTDLFWCSIGDSHIYLCNQSTLIQLNTDHNLGTRLDEMVREGSMTSAAARAYPNRAALTSYLGMPDIALLSQNSVPLSLQKGDIIVQCSDGLYRCISEDDIYRILSVEHDLPKAARILVDSALLVPGEHDNTSVILIRYNGGS